MDLILFTSGRSVELVVLELDSLLTSKFGAIVVGGYRPLYEPSCISARRAGLTPCLIAVTLSEEALSIDLERLKACFSDCVLIRSVYSKVLPPDEQSTRSRVKDVFHVGRRLKQPQKERILSRLEVGSSKSKICKAGNQANEHVVHVVADLRSLSTQEEHQALPGFFLLFLCLGGEKETRSELAKRHDAHRDAVTSLSASESTRLDFVRCHLLAAAALIKPGDFVLDAFVGSGATLDAAVLHGAAAVFGSDRETTCRGCTTICDASSSSWRRHSMDALICDPPYNRRTSGLAETCPEQTLRILFRLAANVVKPGGKVAFWWTDLHSRLDISNMLPANLSLACYATDDLGMGCSSSDTRQEADVLSSWKRVLVVLVAIDDTSEVFSIAAFSSLSNDHKIFPIRLAKEQKSSNSIFSAAWRGDVKSLKAMLEDHEGQHVSCCVNVNEVSDNGVTVLMYSCGFGREEVVQYLCTLQSLDINYANPSDGSTALIRAARFGHANIVKLLLASGANLMHVDKDQGYSAVLHSAAFNHVGVLSSFPPECLAAQVVVSDGCGLLHVCAQWGSLACLDYLLSLPSSSSYFTLRSHDNTTPLHLAARHNHHLVVARLLQAQHLSLSPYDTDATGNTPLSLAVKWQRHRIVALFS